MEFDADTEHDGIWTLVEDTPDGTFWEAARFVAYIENGEGHMRYEGRIPETEPFVLEVFAIADRALAEEAPLDAWFSAMWRQLFPPDYQQDLVTVQFGIWSPAGEPKQRWRVQVGIPGDMGGSGQDALFRAGVRINKEANAIVLAAVVDCIKRRRAAVLEKNNFLT